MPRLFHRPTASGVNFEDREFGIFIRGSSVTYWMKLRELFNMASVELRGSEIGGLEDG